MKRHFYFVLFLLVSLSASAQELSVAERNAQQGFNDTIDRLAPDFVRVSLCVADPTTKSQDRTGLLGHAFLRLQCPTFGLDFCFSYESEPVKGNWIGELKGELRMGLYAVPTDEYVEDYRNWERAVHEYRINMPPEAELRLWEQMDNHMMLEQDMPKDLIKYGCASTVLKYVEYALQPDTIDYGVLPSKYYDLSLLEIASQHLENLPWDNLLMKLSLRDKSINSMTPKQKIVYPADLAEVWSRTTINGEPLLTYVGDLVEADPVVVEKPWFTPMKLAVLILLVTLVFACTKYLYWDWVLLGLQVMVGTLFIILSCLKANFGGQVLILMVLLNPLPAIAWHWRKYWASAYAAILLIGVFILTFWSHMLVDPFFLVLALSYVVLFSKDDVKRFIASRR